MALRCLLALSLIAFPAFAGEPEKPKLVVLVVFDQMRGDYLERWKTLFGHDGFVRMQTEGAWFVNCHYPYATTATGPGHASMLTGCGPNVHGIINNTWYDRASGAVVNCAQSTRYQRVPPLPKPLPKEELADDIQAQLAKEKKTETTTTAEVERGFGNPDRLLAPTFGDAIKAATNGKAKVIGLSFKDRSSLFPVGPKTDGAYWLDNTDGMFVTSSFYRDALPAWLDEINRKHIVDSWFGKPWEKSRNDVDYAKFSGPDATPGEGKGTRQGVTFPHRMDGGLKRPGKSYYEALYTSPFGNELLMEMIRSAVHAEKLGQDDVPDLLTISFSCNDPVGHAWGPDSQEVLDVTLRSDRHIAELLKLLDSSVGKGKYLICLTADHGICPLPEVAAHRGLDARRVSIKSILTDAETHLRSIYDPEAGKDSKVKFIENSTGAWSYLNYKLIESKGLEPAQVAKSLADFLAKKDGILRAFTREQLEGPLDPYDAIGRRMRTTYFADRCGDVGIVLKPYHLDSDPKTGTGTSHGTPHPYDTHVPLIVFGTNVKPGIHREEVVPAAIAAIFAKALGIAPPAKAEYSTPEGLFVDR